MSARRSRRAVLAGVAALGLVAGYLLLATGAATAAAPLLVVSYLALIPAALLV
jgi:hypothetical protein